LLLTNAPTISGPVRPKEGIEYEYAFETTDPNGDTVYYYIEWGGYSNVGEWIGPYSSGEQIILTHTWNKGTYTIKAKAKDVYDQESEWGYLEVSIPVNQQGSQQIILQQSTNPLFLQILGILMYRAPMIN